MSRFQLALNVDNVERSIDFYRTLLGVEPAKVKPGYANFVVANPPLKLVLIENEDTGGTINHLGIEVDDASVVQSEISRLTATGLVTKEESGTVCCYATQDKVWVTAPDGEPWEVYTVLSDAETFSNTTPDPACQCSPKE